MKKLFFTLAACISALAICSCSQQKPLNNEGNHIDFGSETPSQYFFTDIVKVKELNITTNNGNGYGMGSSDRTVLHITLSDNSYNQFSSATFEEFKKLANKIGDIESKEGYYHATPVGHPTTESAISEVKIKTLSLYDESHPQGSSLKDIIRINYQSFGHVFNKALKPTIFGSANHAMYSIEPTIDMPQIKHPALTAETYEGDRLNDGLVMSIEFLQAPTTPKQHIQITLRFENGQELKKDISFDLLEIKK